MSYTASKAQSGSTTVFAINTGSLLSPTWTPIYEITDFTQSGNVNKTVDVTNLQSAAEEFLATLQSGGKFALTMNRVSGDAGQVAVKASFEAKTVVGYKITLPEAPGQTVAGDSYGFAALVSQMDDLSSLSAAKQIITKCELMVSGAVTLTEGS